MFLKSLLPFALLTACFSFQALAQPGADDTAAPARSSSAAGASIGFGNLSDGDVVSPAFVVSFTISGMGVAPAGTQIDNTGHFHLLIDLPELPAMDRPLPVTPNVRHFGKGQTQTPLDLSEGEHTLQLLLADYAHVPHDPPVLSGKIRIVVANDAAKPGDD